MNLQNFLVDNLIRSFQTYGKDTTIVGVKDNAYLDFLIKINGGLFFDGSLIIYGLGDIPKWFSFVDMNLLLHEKYGTMIQNCQFFACDIFGNQFGFLLEKVCFLNIETGEFTIIADDFDGWQKVLKENTDYYTGQSILRKWERTFDAINLGERLCPKKPFVIGGEYVVENLYRLNLISLIEYCSDLAHQIHNLPEGTRINFKVVD